MVDHGGERAQRLPPLDVGPGHEEDPQATFDLRGDDQTGDGQHRRPDDDGQVPHPLGAAGLRKALPSPQGHHRATEDPHGPPAPPS